MLGLSLIWDRLRRQPTVEDDAAFDDCMRAAVRGGVAGAVPQRESWERLQGRIERETLPAWSLPMHAPMFSPGPAFVALLAWPRLIQGGACSLLQ
jgi:hypothetical protein